MNLQRWWQRDGCASWLAGTLLLATSASSAAISVMDDGGKPVNLAASATRIVSLAPHATELLFAAGAGKSVIGVSSHSDYPPEAAAIASVGNSSQPDIERILSLHPDLVVAWKSGNSARLITRLRKLGIAVFESEPQTLDQIASSIERLATLAGTQETGLAAASVYKQQLEILKKQYQRRAAVSVFYQIWSQPLMTLNRSHLVSEVITLCGGQNIFGNLPQIAPSVSLEAVVRTDPEVIFISDDNTAALKRWEKFPGLAAVRHHNIFTVNSSLMNRPGPRILTGARQLCENLDQARQHRAQ